MQVRILEDTGYTPRANDSPKCVGQLRRRPGCKLVEFVAADGSKIIREEVAPMEWCFRKGATPDLADDVAQDFIARGIADPMPNADEVSFVSTREILDGMSTEVE